MIEMLQKSCIVIWLIMIGAGFILSRCWSKLCQARQKPIHIEAPGRTVKVENAFSGFLKGDPRS